MVEVVVVHNSALVLGIKHCTVSAPHLSGSLHSAIGMPSSSDQSSQAGAELSTHSGELRHGTCHFYTIYTGISKISSVYGNLKDQMKLDLCICEALSYMLVPWKPQLWAWLSITTNIN